jgi:hypothetical protein
VCVELLQEGCFTVFFPQNSDVVPQKPNFEQHTFRGQDDFSDQYNPKPGSHSAFLSQLATQSSPQTKKGFLLDIENQKCSDPKNFSLSTYSLVRVHRIQICYNSLVHMGCWHHNPACSRRYQHSLHHRTHHQCRSNHASNSIQLHRGSLCYSPVLRSEQ